MGALVLVSCHGASEGGRVELERFERHVRCDDDGCSSEPGNLWSERPAPVEGFAFLSLESTAGLLIYAEFPIDGGLAQLEIEVNEGQEPAVVYVERVDGDAVFVAGRVAGVIEVPDVVLDDDCGCQTGRFELRFWDEGEDGELNTEDDEVRQLGSGRFERGETFCLPSERFELDESLQVRRVDRCPRPASTRPTSSGGSSSSDRSHTSHDTAACGGSSDGSASCDGSSCEGGSTTCDGDSTASCEGDGGGCESDDSASCDGDSAETCATVVGSTRRPPRGGLRDGRLQFVLLLAAIVWDLRRRARCVLA